MAVRPKYDHDIPEGHPSTESRIFHPDDVRLRRHGFKIERRPRRGEPTWNLHGILFGQSEALEVADDLEKEARRGK